LDSRGSRFSERFDIDDAHVLNGAAELAADDRTRQGRQTKLRKKRRGIAVGNEAVAVNVSEKSGQEEEKNEEKREGGKTGCTGIKARGITGVQQFRSKVELWTEKLRSKDWTEKLRAKVRKVLCKTRNKELARNF
jgi:hypothetical protein